MGIVLVPVSLTPALSRGRGRRDGLRRACDIGRMLDDLPRLLMIAGIFVLAGLVKGVIGLGLPTVAIGLLSLVMRPVEAAALLVVPAMVTNVWQLAAGGAVRPLVRRFRGLLVMVVLGTWAGAGVLAAGPRGGPWRRWGWRSGPMRCWG